MADLLRWLDAKSRFEENCFAAIREALQQLEGEAWPSLGALNQIASDQRLKNFRGMPLKFIGPSINGAAPQHYETRIAETGQIATRENWHDLFNALQWLTFPKAKAAISEMHTRLIAANDGEVKARSIRRDVLTLFDEGGIIISSTDPSLLDLIRQFQWRTLFVDRREDVKACMHFFLAGHSVLEKMLNPFIGITAKALLIDIPQSVDKKIDKLSKPAQILAFDAIVSEWLMNVDNLSTTRNLHPLPILGVPGWDVRNESAGFYDDNHYFRRGRVKSP